jgi:hypothetical protein
MLNLIFTIPQLKRPNPAFRYTPCGLQCARLVRNLNDIECDAHNVNDKRWSKQISIYKFDCYILKHTS